jgi:hypothetical protein
MERQLVIRLEDSNFRVVFHNYMGPFEGRQIGEWLQLEEVEPPASEDGYGPLRIGQFYMWHAMQRHPDLHALVRGDQLEKVATAVDHFHVRVVEGAPFLPEVSPNQRETPQEQEPANYIAYIEKGHRSVWSKGPKAIFLAFLLRAIPAFIAIFATIVVMRHVGDHRRDVGLEAVFAKASAPTIEQSTIARFWNPDHSNELRTTITSVRCMVDERIVLADGSVVKLAGLGEVRPMLEAARDNNAVPKLEVDIVDQRAVIRRALVGAQQFGRTLELVKLQKLPPSADPPTRTRNPRDSEWLELPGLPLENRADLRALLGKRISLVGKLQPNGDSYRFRTSEAKLDLRPVRVWRDLENFLSEFADGRVELKVDLILQELSESGSEFVGSGEFHSISAQNYHIVARR